MQHSYQALATEWARNIRSGRYAVGERLPSVRQAALGQGVSVSTVVRSYRHLEAQGLVHAHPKSGMFVADWKAQRARRPASTAAPVAEAPPAYEQFVSLNQRMAQLYALTEQPLRHPLHLATTTPPWYPCKALARIGQRVLRTEVEALGVYPTGTGLPAFKAALVDWLAGFGLDLDPQQLLVTNGSTEALSVALRAVARPGDAVIVESPVYFGLLQLLENLGLRTLEVPCVPGQGLSLEALEYALEHQDGVRAVVAMPNFQNPLGCTMLDSHKRRLLKLVERFDVALIEDDAFGDLSPAAERPQPVKAWDRQGRVIYCGSFSKSLAPAFRVGWVAGGRWHARLQALKLGQSLVTPVFEQAVLAEYLASGAFAPHLRQLRERLAGNATWARAAVRRHFPAGTRIVSDAGGLWLWLELATGCDTLALLRQAVLQGVAFTPGTMFSTQGKYSHLLRVNTAVPAGTELDRALALIGALAGAWPAPAR